MGRVERPWAMRMKEALWTFCERLTCLLIYRRGVEGICSRMLPTLS